MGSHWSDRAEGLILRATVFQSLHFEIVMILNIWAISCRVHFFFSSVKRKKANMSRT